ncbi:alpha/beta hydrolase [Neorhizobium galegae]|uniref:Acetyl esterase n=1 Tax=Neorhizobium galegae bv. officinalis TaxID=323656 RepID=A0A0T7GFT9_NEOGA|nr:alpha/beta hydrolase fold domain-containing protein [Neorhizobium galegae]CDZ46124.1 Acetyl esterase [Neorhizobium galegae bv. officinalis]
MKIDPAEIFNPGDFASARHLNRVLSWMPRYHPGRRLNARLIDSVIGIGQRLLPRSRSPDISIETIELPVGNHQTTIRILQPRPVVKALLLHFHGGAWVLGNSRLDDGWNMRMAKSCGVTVASGDFHLAVDDDLEQTIQDAVAITGWALDHVADFQTDQLIIEGESSGAHLAACALTRLARHRSLEEVAGFVSLCGAFDLGGSKSLRTAKGSLIIEPKSAQRNLDRLTANLAVSDADLSPVFGDLSAMPPALFIAGALDPIMEDTIRMHDRWQRQAGRSDLLVVPEGPHGFERLPTRLAAKTRQFMADWINRTLS